MGVLLLNRTTAELDALRDAGGEGLGRLDRLLDRIALHALGRVDQEDRADARVSPRSGQLDRQVVDLVTVLENGEVLRG